MILMPLICHLAAWRLEKTTFGFADRSRAELQQLVPQPELKKHKVEVGASRTTRSQATKGAEQMDEKRKREKEEEAAQTWKKISEEHHREKEAEERRRAKQQDKGKAKVYEEDTFQDQPEFEIPQQMPEPPAFDTTRLTSLLLASTLMQTMKARNEEAQQEDNAFKALQAVASTTSDNYKDDEAYQRYQSQYNDVPNREREFLKTLIHFQTQNLQIFERKQSYINKLEVQLRTQENMKIQLEEALRREDQWRQQVQEAEKKMHQANQQYQEEIRIREEELRIVKAHNEQLIKEKEWITQEHIQQAYLTNLSLHQRTTQLEKALQEAENLSRERARQIRELEEIPKIPISPDEQLETEHRIVMQASSNMVDLALEHHSVDQTLTLYYNSLTASSVQYSTDLTQPVPPHQLTLLLQKYSHYTHPILAMSFFRGDLCLEDQTEIF